MIIVKVRNGNITGALKELKKRVKKAGIFDELKEREYFVSKSQKRRAKKQAAIREHQKTKNSKHNNKYY